MATAKTELWRMQFGRKSERLEGQIEQLELMLEEFPGYIAEIHSVIAHESHHQGAK